MPREAFIAEVRSFEARLAQQMEDRVAQVLAGGVDPGIRMDRAALQREQEMRSAGMLRLAAGAVAEDRLGSGAAGGSEF